MPTLFGNNTSELVGKLLMLADGAVARTVTNLFTFDRGANPPFAVGASSTKVNNLDADKLDGLDGASYATRTGVETLTNKTLTAAVLGGTTDVSGGQLKFPSTQAPSTDANTLDDYEEGSWTPVIGGATSETGQSYTTQVGRYIKIGKQVTLFGNVVLSNKGTITGAVVIKGIPAGLISANVTSYFAAGVVGYWSNLGVAQVSVPMMIRGNSQVLELLAVPAATVTAATMAATDVANTTQLIFSITYQAEN